jgi:hypothetical protein
MLTAEDRLFNHDSTWTILNFAKRCEDASHSKARVRNVSRRLFHFAKLLECAHAVASL